MRAKVRDLEAADYVVHVDVKVKHRGGGASSTKDKEAPDSASVAAFKQLNDFCNRDVAQGEAGLWTLDCDNVLAQNEKVLDAFLAKRRLIERVMGDGRYLLNPTACFPIPRLRECAVSMHALGEMCVRLSLSFCPRWRSARCLAAAPKLAIAATR